MRSSRPIRCSTTRRLPGQVEQHEAAAELEVATLASAFGGHQQARTLGLAEAGDFGVAARRRQLLVEDAGRQLRAVAERRAQHLQRLAVRHEDERLLSRVSPARRLRQQPVEARIGGVHRLGLLRAVRVRPVRAPRPSAAPDASARRMRSIFCRRATACGAAAPRSAASTASLQLPARRVVERDRNADPRRQAADVGAARGAGARRQRRSRARRASKLTSSGNSCGRRS